ncbi:MAG TPA: tRNA lysidine(34) synthetase TilS [Candidatus Kapabacteria bacterium]|nr:tRNA lysidine(34) synthetase TilS [Candidatus Kapabacteria bacterium]
MAKKKIVNIEKNKEQDNKVALLENAQIDKMEAKEASNSLDVPNKEVKSKDTKQINKKKQNKHKKIDQTISENINIVVQEKQLSQPTNELNKVQVVSEGSLAKKETTNKNKEVISKPLKTSKVEESGAVDIKTNEEKITQAKNDTLLNESKVMSPEQNTKKVATPKPGLNKLNKHKKVNKAIKQSESDRGKVDKAQLENNTTDPSAIGVDIVISEKSTTTYSPDDNNKQVIPQGIQQNDNQINLKEVKRHKQKRGKDKDRSKKQHSVLLNVANEQDKANDEISDKNIIMLDLSNLAKNQNTKDNYTEVKQGNKQELGNDKQNKHKKAINNKAIKQNEQDKQNTKNENATKVDLSNLAKNQNTKDNYTEVKQGNKQELGNDKQNKHKKAINNKAIKQNEQGNTSSLKASPIAEKPLKIEPPKKVKQIVPEIVITINPKKQLTKEQEKNPLIQNFFQKLEHFLRMEVQIEKGQRLLVAMSGGVDSSVLFDALSVLSMKMKFVIYVLHFNHKLRGLSSERDEKLVNQLSKDYNVQYFNASGNVKQYAEKNSLSIEYAARQLRYNFFEKVARTLSANFVATAHTADDNAETFFLNLFRGSGLTGLSGIPSKRNLVKNVMMIRPLISFRKKDLIEYAKLRKLRWFEDETNSLLNYTRNKIRLSLIPRLEEEFNPSITDIINQTTRLMSGADRLIRDIVKKNYPLVVEEASQEKFTIKIPMLMANEEFIQGEIIQHLWLKYFRLQPLPMQTIMRILNLHNSQSGAICEINSLYFVLRDRNNLIFSKRQYEENIKLLINVPGKFFIGRYRIEFSEIDRTDIVFDDNPNIEYFDISIKDSFLEVRNWLLGDSFQPLGMKGEMKISDFLINEKIPVTEKASVIVLTNKTEIIWVVGKRISDKFKIKKNANKVVKAVLIKNDKR